MQKGAWTRLLSPAAAYLRQQDLLESESKLPDDEVFATRPVAVVAAAVPAYSCTWRKEYRYRVRINVAELEAFLREKPGWLAAPSPSVLFLALTLRSAWVP